MKSPFRWPTVSQALIASAAIAVVAFFFTGHYAPRFSVIGNAMIAKIRLTQDCYYDALKDAVTPENCGINIPYRWILAVLAAFVGIVALKQKKQ